MIIRTVALSIALALAVPPAALACGTWGPTEEAFGQHAAHLIAQRWRVTPNRVEVADVKLQDGESAVVDVRIWRGGNYMFRRRYVVMHDEHGYRVKLVPEA
jgi:hypothetical protein